jgi:hypothetical protein
MAASVRNRLARLERRQEAAPCPRCGSSARRAGVLLACGDGPAPRVCTACGRVPALIRRYIGIRLSEV